MVDPGQATKGSGMIEDLKADHRRMRELFRQILAETDKKRCKELFLELQKEITTHSVLEEELLYPAFRDAAETPQQRWLYHEAVEEHDAADVSLHKIRKVGYGSEEFYGKVLALQDMVEHHAEEEERDFFPLCAQVLGVVTLQELGERAADYRQRIEEKGRSRRGANATRRKTARKARSRRLLSIRHR